MRESRYIDFELAERPCTPAVHNNSKRRPAMYTFPNDRVLLPRSDKHALLLSIMGPSPRSCLTTVLLSVTPDSLLKLGSKMPDKTLQWPCESFSKSCRQCQSLFRSKAQTKPTTDCVTLNLLR